MIKEFSKKILFVPRSWVNAVARWIQGVHSPDGTIIIQNTVNPGADGSIALDVNLDRVIAVVRDRFNLSSPMDRNSVRDVVWDMVDGASIIADGRRIAVSKDWIENYVGNTMTLGAPEAPSPTNLGGGVTSGLTNDGTTGGTSSGTTAACTGGMKFMVATTCAYGNAQTRIWFRDITVGKDGRIVSVGAPSASTDVDSYGST